MDGHRILQAAAYHRSFLLHTGVSAERVDEDLLLPDRERTFAHLLWMTGEVPSFVAAGRDQKAMRWICFAQGVLWHAGLATIHSLKDVNRDPSESFDSRV